MNTFSDKDFEAASARAQSDFAPLVEHAYYDRQTGHIVVALSNACTFSFPAKFGQGLEEADDEDIAKIETSPSGLHWPDLDVDLSIEGLLNGRFGTKRHMHHLKEKIESTRSDV